MARTETVYPPLDCLKQVAEDLWIVDSGPFRVLGGLGIPIRMTIVRLGNGDMWLHSPTRYDPALHESIEKIGPIRHLVAPNTVHWAYLAAWQSACRGALIWSAPGLGKRRAVRRAGLAIDRELESTAPVEWMDDFEQIIVAAAWGVTEVAFFHKESHSLILTDLIENFESHKLPKAARPVMRLLGTLAPDGGTPLHFRLIIRLKRRRARDAARQVTAWHPDRVIFAHGKWYDQDGARRLVEALGWLVD